MHKLLDFLFNFSVGSLMRNDPRFVLKLMIPIRIEVYLVVLHEQVNPSYIRLFRHFIPCKIHNNKRQGGILRIL